MPFSKGMFVSVSDMFSWKWVGTAVIYSARLTVTVLISAAELQLV